mmetsp:Transcript_40597/g.126527  ORF Transcript_40597/g.126527 Transcript_40597/m.126527 type:complete len:212 (-) Transcript_40597:432-1067(-)
MRRSCWGRRSSTSPCRRSPPCTATWPRASRCTARGALLLRGGAASRASTRMRARSGPGSGSSASATPRTRPSAPLATASRRTCRITSTASSSQRGGWRSSPACSISGSSPDWGSPCGRSSAWSARLACSARSTRGGCRSCPCRRSKTPWATPTGWSARGRCSGLAPSRTAGTTTTPTTSSSGSTATFGSASSSSRTGSSCAAAATAVVGHP